MRYQVLGTDYDETLAVEGAVHPDTFAALRRFKNSGRKVVLVTGRQLTELEAVFPEFTFFDRIIAENGGTIFNPATSTEEILAKAPPPELIIALQKEKVPLSVGRVLIASHEPYEKIIVQVIRDLGLEHHIIFNKGSIMILPSGINKATGFAAALKELGLSVDSAVGIGDGENDHAFLDICEYGVAVSNAVESLKAKADWVTPNPSGAGVRDLVDRLLSLDL